MSAAEADADGPVEVTVVYLCRGAGGGLAAARRFLDSYANHPAGAPHRLLVLMKGWNDADAKAATEQLVLAAGGDLLELPDDGFDLGAYFRAAEKVGTQWICLLNTHSEILASGWLRKLHQAAGAEGVGAAGATGSFGGMAPTLSLLAPVLRRARARQPLPLFLLYTTVLLALHPVKRLLWRGWPAVPNPNLRTNAFHLRTELLRAFGRQVGVPRTKTQAWAIESGRGSLTRWLEKKGLSSVIVDSRGCAHFTETWLDSGTFRTPGQPNLMVADNQTRSYERADPWARRVLETAAWGRALSDAPESDLRR